MSECLIVEIVVAPDEFSDAAIARAREHAQKLDELLAKGAPIEEFDRLGVRVSDIEDVFGPDELANCEDVLDAFVVWWHTGLGGGDVCRRDLPGRDGWSITVVGGTSTGDNSFGGEGYRLVDQADVLGLLAALGAL